MQVTTGDVKAELKTRTDVDFTSRKVSQARWILFKGHIFRGRLIRELQLLAVLVVQLCRKEEKKDEEGRIGDGNCPEV